MEICLATRSTNGGLLEINDLKAALTSKRGSSAEPISLDDIERSISKLKILGSGFDLIRLRNRTNTASPDKIVVQSVPVELNMDHTTILVLAEADDGHICAESVSEHLPEWSIDRIQGVLDQLLKEGMCWIDSQADVVHYWFPALCDFL